MTLRNVSIRLVPSSSSSNGLASIFGRATPVELDFEEVELAK